ncbi:excinuclease ABC subunit UvrA [Myxococcota bacterium]
MPHPVDHLYIRGARQHNLRLDELRIPKQSLVVLTGVSGSGKSSLAFDTLYAEGQRRYVESLSSYARQFLGQLEKPAYDQIRGLCPTIAIEQKVAGANPRSTVGTMTEVHDYLRVLYARVGVQHCPDCGHEVSALSLDEIAARLRQIGQPVLLLAPLVENRKGTCQALLDDLKSRGFVRVRHQGVVRRLDQELRFDPRHKHTLELVVDRLNPARSEPLRLTGSLETALEVGRGVALAVVDGGEAGPPLRFSQARACDHCRRGLPELTPQSFSFNSPLGMCPACGGLGHKSEIDPALLVSEPQLSIREGAIGPLASTMQRGTGLGYGMLDALRREFGLDLDRPWCKLPARQRDLVLYGTGDRRVQVEWSGTHGQVSWPMQFEGLIRTMMRRFRETQSESMRRHYSQFMANAECRDCGGTRLRPESLAVTVGELSIAQVAHLPVGRAHQHFTRLELGGQASLIASEVLKEVVHRLAFLAGVGLSYVSLDRAGASLSGGEAQRIRLAAQLGSELSGVLYVLDEPSIGLHQHDGRRLIDTLCRLRDMDNSVIVVEHDAAIIESADHVIDFGPGAGHQGGQVVFQGSPDELKRADTLTGRYLSGRARIELGRPPRSAGAWLTVRGAKEVDVSFPLGVLTAVTGVSGAGKSSLVGGILYPALWQRLHGGRLKVGQHQALEGVDQLDKVIRIDQSAIGRTPRSNPATYTKCFDLVREIFALTPEARTQGYGPGRFSFNVAGGRCEACAGDGVKRVEMHFLPDVFVPCEVCHGERYSEATLSVRYRGLNIAQVLDTSATRALELFSAHPKLTHILTTLVDVGLGYLKLGQPAPTLSGGEAQRVKLSRELARPDTGRTLYVLDEPTTGLHFDDIQKLLGVLDRLVQAGNTVVIVEHHLDVIRCADHVIDLGPEGGEGGGEVVVAGSPGEVAACPTSHTGAHLRPLLGLQPPRAVSHGAVQGPGNGSGRGTKRGRGRMTVRA